MSFDSVFHGAPTSNNGQAVPSGIASLGIDVVSGQLYFRTPAVAGWQPTAGGSGGASTSDDVTNESSVSGATVTDALNQLLTDAIVNQPCR